MEDDGIHLGKYKRVDLHRRETACSRCGNPTANMGDRCAACVNKSFFKEALRQQARAFKEHPKVELQVARDKKQVHHAILIGHPGWSFCGVRPSEPIYKRRCFSLESLPPELCGDCRELISKAQEVGE